ncbi:uncharacterized protein LOC120111418 [Phoenix dactylifera]|uniref:Uncharacterized protein LOC120111418 n=1 Tax=Phoenix dactylifera TaxID=42345 RepID=A0A8B9AM71_PHODC|nr:uncharacterized protein LOC120111418 [Phoenix dactylifera]
MNWDSRRRRRCETVTKAENPGGDELGARTRTAYLSARRKERIELPDYGGPITFSDFVNHPSGVEALLNTRALHSFRPLDSNTYRCTLQKIQFLKFEVAPVLDLRVTPTREGCTVEMVDCRFEGSETVEQQNHAFSGTSSHCHTVISQPNIYMGKEMVLSRSKFSLTLMFMFHLPFQLTAAD